MKLSENWLREWVDPPLTIHQLTEQLTMAGLEVNSLTPDLDDNLIEIDLTPNRGDCASILGVAREVGILNEMPLRSPEIVMIQPTINQEMDITVKDDKACLRYVGRIIRNIKVGVQTPTWMQEKLRRSDIQVIHPVVDVLNYVMIELGQPMHAFDLDKISKKIIVRQANLGETLELLDGRTQTLSEDTLVIADSEKVLAMAGIMGGSSSGVSDNTQQIFLESALFDPQRIAGKGRHYGLHTDSQYRFERGVDPKLQALAIERATKLILEICGGEVGPMTDVVIKALSVNQPIILAYDNVIRMLGNTIAVSTVKNILDRLNCEAKSIDGTDGKIKWGVTPPSYRYDFVQEIDLIEEIARIVGYHNIPSQLPYAKLNFIGQSEKVVSTDRIKRAFVDLGYQEVITYSFVDEQLQKLMFPTEKALALKNPISEDMGVMRVSLWPSLLNVVKYNQHRQQLRLKLFEVGNRFYYRHDKFIQEKVLSGVVCGHFLDENWNGKPQPVDFFDAKQHIENLWRLLGFHEPLTFISFNKAAACHPGQCAQILWHGEEVGIVGKLHPQIQTQLDLLGPIILFELKLEGIHRIPPIFKRPSRFPEIRRDIAVIVDEKLPGNHLINFVRNSTGDILREVKIFDVYIGKGIDSGRKSVALGLILQHSSRTLVDQEVDNIIHTIVSGLEKEFDAKLRE